MGHYGQVSHIAEVAGNTTRRNDFIAALKKSLEEWFTAGGPQQFYYDKTWNRMIGYPASYGSDNRLSDHHFHYGYFIFAAANIARYDTAWARSWGGMVELLVRDINSWDDNDPMFGRFQNFDPYEGHGWADGMGFAAGNNQESSSESMDCNSAIISWGVNTGNKTIRDMGIFMYVNETRAIEQYWWNVDKAVYPASYNHTCCGMVWSNGGAYGTWFSGDAGLIHAINFIPVHGGSLYMGRRPDYIPLNYAEGFTGAWPDAFYAYLAFSDPAKALSSFNGLGSAVATGSMALVYYTISSCLAGGRLSTTIVGNWPTYAVFDKGSTRTYTGYNPEFRAATVFFNDGFSMEVPARTQLTKTGPVVALHTLEKLQRAPSGSLLTALRINVFDGLRISGLQKDVTMIEIFDLRGKKVMRSPVYEGRIVDAGTGTCVGKGTYILKIYK
jgi:hypothetical protein